MAEETAELIPQAGPRLGPAERRLLAGMPLHAITSVYGEAGLRERLVTEIAQFPAADRGRAQDALASRLHAGDLRQREPYANHLSVTWNHAVTPSFAMSAGCQTTLAVLAGRFGGRTAALVAAVTNPGWEPGRDEHEQYREHVLASLEASPWARVIKASDFTDNAVGIIHTTGPKLSKLAGKYGPLVPPLRELILRPDTPLDADIKDMIAAQLDAARGRFAAIGHGSDGDSEVGQPSGAS